MLKTFPKTHIAAAVVISAVVCTAMVFSPSADVEAKRMSVSLDLESGEIVQTPLQQRDKARSQTSEPASPDLTEDGATQPSVVAKDGKVGDGPLLPAAKERKPVWSEFQVKRGDTLSSLFKRAGFDDRLMLSVIHGNGEAEKIQRLYAGETLSFATGNDGELTAVKLKRSRLESLKIERTETGFVGKRVIREPEIQTKYAEAEIESSLFGAGQQAGLTDKLTMELAGIFGWDIDFILDIRKGDRFSVVYEELYLDGEKIDNGKILAANFYNRDRALAAVFYTDKNGVSDYFTPEGRSMRKAFLRTPVDFARISSSFNLNRRHPVLNTIRAHKGTDYAAGTGTPIKASGQGKVIHAGRKGGYGNAVIIQHGNNITTLYAHMNRFAKGIRSGKYVKQGQVIGYVGSTGLVTGPHLHYEFRVNGTHRNPATVKLPDATPIPTSEIARFKAATEQTLAQLETYQDSGQLTLARGE